jgi:hypothetical protein
MIVNSVIVEQLEANGKIRSFRMQPPPYGRELVIAFADEYEGRRSGPFHFLDGQDAQRFSQGFAQCRERKIGKEYFYRDGEAFHVELGWEGIPTAEGTLSYYALSLPKHAIPVKLSITDPHMRGHELHRTVRRDDARQRYVVYVRCNNHRLNGPMFSFCLVCDFVVDSARFSSSEYRDAYVESNGGAMDEWTVHYHPPRLTQEFYRFLEQGITAHRPRNNPWIAGSFYLVAFLSVLVALRVVFGELNPLFIPGVFGGGILAVAIIGALQLRNDDRLKEKSFIQLMLKTFEYVPILRQLMPGSSKAGAAEPVAAEPGAAADGGRDPGSS